MDGHEAALASGDDPFHFAYPVFGDLLFQFRYPAFQADDDDAVYLFMGGKMLQRPDDDGLSVHFHELLRDIRVAHALSPPAGKDQRVYLVILTHRSLPF